MCKQNQRKFSEYLQIKYLAQREQKRGKITTHVLSIEKLLTFFLLFSKLNSNKLGRLLLKCDGTSAETRFHLSAKRTSPFKSARGGRGSVQSTTGSRGVRISGSNAGYTKFRGSVNNIGYPHHSSSSPSLPHQCVTVCHHISTGRYTAAPVQASIGLQGCRNLRRSKFLAFLLAAESTVVPLCGRKVEVNEKSQLFHRESNPRPSGLQASASTTTKMAGRNKRMELTQIRSQWRALVSAWTVISSQCCTQITFTEEMLISVSMLIQDPTHAPSGSYLQMVHGTLAQKGSLLDYEQDYAGHHTHCQPG